MHVTSDPYYRVQIPLYYLSSVLSTTVNNIRTIISRPTKHTPSTLLYWAYPPPMVDMHQTRILWKTDRDWCMKIFCSTIIWMKTNNLLPWRRRFHATLTTTYLGNTVRVFQLWLLIAFVRGKFIIFVLFLSLFLSHRDVLCNILIQFFLYMLYIQIWMNTRTFSICV